MNGRALLARHATSHWRAAALGAAILTGCAATPRTPEALRDAWLEALADDDPGSAWALMSPAARAATGREAFDARWAAQRSAREAMVSAAAAAPPSAIVTAAAAVTITTEGHVLRWASVDGRLVVTEGLSPAVDRSTPQATLAAFAAALRQQGVASLAAVVAPTFAEGVEQARGRRADAIEALLREPGALRVAGDEASLELGPGVIIRLRRFPDGWRVVEAGP